jgi:hypothetical protein
LLAPEYPNSAFSFKAPRAAEEKYPKPALFAWLIEAANVSSSRDWPVNGWNCPNEQRSHHAMFRKKAVDLIRLFDNNRIS